MHGNVFEWCLDGKRDYGQSAVSDPQGPLETGAGRVMRGGSWSNDAWYCRSAYRSDGLPGGRFSDLGFRCARVQG